MRTAAGLLVLALLLGGCEPTKKVPSPQPPKPSTSAPASST
jgi:hypothetical protein